MSQNQMNVWIAVYRFSVPILLAITAYFLMGVVKQINAQDERIRSVELLIAETSGNRFSSKDWALNKAVLDQRHNILDRRTTRLEENMLAIRDILERIEDKIDK